MSTKQSPRAGDGALRQEYWAAFRSYMAENSPVSCGKATRDDWMFHGGRLNNGTLWTVARTRMGQLGVEYTFEDAARTTVFSMLKKHRGAIDAFLAPDEPYWQEREDRHLRLLGVRREADLHDRSSWSECFVWTRQRLERILDVLRPYLGGIPERGDRRRWDEVAFFSELGRVNPSGVPAGRAILEWAKGVMPDVFWGSGGRFGSFCPRIRTGQEYAQLFSVLTSGAMVLRLTDAKHVPPFDTRGLRNELLACLNRVPCFDLPAEVLRLRQTLPLRLVGEPDILPHLLEVFEWFAAESRR